MIPKELDQIEEQDLRYLIDHWVPELKTMEYKSTLLGNAPKERKEFLADVSSFANASGGDMVFGITVEAESHRPKDVSGLDIQDVDLEIQRLDSLIRDGVKPRIPSVVIQPVPLSSGRTALVIRVRRSWIAPHRVSLEGHDKFYARGSNGKYPMDVDELRTAFTLTADVRERIRRFREERLAAILANEGPVPLLDGGRIALHLIPLDSFGRPAAHDVSAIVSDPGLYRKMAPMLGSAEGRRYNLDGFLTFDVLEGEPCSYFQFYRNGVIEAVDGAMLRAKSVGSRIPGVKFERALIQALPRYVDLLKSIGVATPILLFLALLGVKGFQMGVGKQREEHNGVQVALIDREVIVLPETVLEDFAVDASAVLRPSFDAIWNACGYASSPNYDKNGRWGTKLLVSSG